MHRSEYINENPHICFMERVGPNGHVFNCPINKSHADIGRFRIEDMDAELIKYIQYEITKIDEIIQEYETLKEKISNYHGGMRILLKNSNIHIKSPTKNILENTIFDKYVEVCHWFETKLPLVKDQIELYKNLDSNIESFMKNFNGFILSDEEIAAILARYLNNTEYCTTKFEQFTKVITFKENTLLALKVLNRFAKENEIRVIDAHEILEEYISELLVY